jgi:hypothetical protein
MAHALRERIKGKTSAKNVNTLKNDILIHPRSGSALKKDIEKPMYDKNGNIIKEFYPTAKSHGFSDIIDNYADKAKVFQLKDGAKIYQIEGGYNGKIGRFEWILDKGKITHRMFVEGGKISGKSIK